MASLLLLVVAPPPPLKGTSLLQACLSAAVFPGKPHHPMVRNQPPPFILQCSKGKTCQMQQDWTVRRLAAAACGRLGGGDSSNAVRKCACQRAPAEDLYSVVEVALGKQKRRTNQIVYRGQCAAAPPPPLCFPDFAIQSVHPKDELTPSPAAFFEWPHVCQPALLKVAGSDGH